MKKLTLLLTLTLSMLFSSTAFAEWTKVTSSVSGDDFYVDFDRIRKHEGYVYYWTLSNYLEPSTYGDLSDEKYRKGDCKLFRDQILSSLVYKQAMGKGDGDGPYNPSSKWVYPKPNSILEIVLQSVCSH